MPCGSTAGPTGGSSWICTDALAPLAPGIVTSRLLGSAAVLPPLVEQNVVVAGVPQRAVANPAPGATVPMIF